MSPSTVNCSKKCSAAESWIPATHHGRNILPPGLPPLPQNRPGLRNSLNKQLLPAVRPSVRPSLALALSSALALVRLALAVALTMAVALAMALAVALAPRELLSKNLKIFKISKVLRMGLPIVENLSGLSGNIFSLSRIPQLHFNLKSENWSNHINIP